MKPSVGKIVWPLCCWLLLNASAAGPVLAAQERAPLSVRVVLSKAGALIKDKKYDQAIAVLRAFQARGKSSAAAGNSAPGEYHHAETYFALGNCYLLKQAYDTAAGAYEEAVRQDPALIGAWLNLAKASYERSDYLRAAQCFRQAYEHAQEKKPENLYFSAVAFQMASQMGSCLETYEMLFRIHTAEIQPSWRESYVQALLTADQPRRALPHIRYLTDHCSGEKRVQWQELMSCLVYDRSNRLNLF